MTDPAQCADPHPMFRWERGTDGIVVITMDDPDHSVNPLNDRFRRELPALVDHLHAERDQVSGVIITSAKRVFSAGGDLGQLLAATPAQAGDMTSLIRDFQRATRRLEALGKPVVAAINGAALGSGLELALACTHRIAVDAPTVAIGLPEVTFGLLPGGGGVARSVRLLGLHQALTEVLLTGRAFRPAAARALGLVGDLVADASALLPAARRWIAAHPDAVQPWNAPGYLIPGGTPGMRAVAATLPALPATLRRQHRGPLLPGIRNLIAAAVEGAQVDIDTALQIEARYCAELACGQVSTNLIRSRFYERRAIERGAGRPAGFPPYQAARVAVLGAGLTGAAVASACAEAGLPVVSADVTLDGTPAATAARAAAGADLVIEAVGEDPGLKRQVLGEVARCAAPGAVIASVTSTLPVSALAPAVAAPENLIGLHLPAPVDQMPLVEVVAGARTSDRTLARALDLARQLGKTPIVVSDRHGSFTRRVISSGTDEAVAMVGEGIRAASVEQAAAQAGYPVGPLALLDEVSLALSRPVRREAAAAASGTGPPPHPAAAVIDRMLGEFGRGGRAAGAGFYDYEHDHDRGQVRRTRLWPGLAAAFGPVTTDVPFADMQERLLFAGALEAVRCLDEGVLRSVREANVGSLLGAGFPAWTGGVLQYVNQYRGGPAGFAARAGELAERYGDRFRPPAALAELARAGGQFR